MSLIGLLFLVLIVCVVIWATRALLAAFSVGEPIRTVVWIAVVLLVLFWAASQAGLVSGLRL